MACGYVLGRFSWVGLEKKGGGFPQSYPEITYSYRAVGLWARTKARHNRAGQSEDQIAARIDLSLSV